MAKLGVIVRRLNSIENLGSMDVLCTDKTGTLTEGVVRLDGAVDRAGEPVRAVLRFAHLNAAVPDRPREPAGRRDLSRAKAARRPCTPRLRLKVDEIPYDFVRKRLSVVAARPPPVCAR
jgi:Mg2+-importing ATPase